MMDRNNSLGLLSLALLLSLACLSGCRAFSVPHGAIQHRQSMPTAFRSSNYNSQQNAFWKLPMATENQEGDGKKNRPFWLDPGTKGGAVFLSLVAFVVPIIFYQIITNVFNVDGLEAGKWIGGGFTAFATLAWVSTYIFRVATKDMTYAKQLKDYENAVIAKRLEELDEDELQALVEEVERDEF